MQYPIPRFSRIVLLCLAAFVVALLLFLLPARVTHSQASRQHQDPAPLQPIPEAVGLALTVNSLGDAADASIGNGLCDTDPSTPGEQCTLRAALLEANSTQNADLDTINFSVTGTINLTGGLPSVFAFTTINGPGSALLTIRRDTGGDYNIFLINGVGVSISGLTITNGKTGNGVAGGSAGDGGGIRNFGTLTMTDVVVTGNRTGDGGAGDAFGGRAGRGAGVYNSGTLTMTNCAITGNIGGRGGDGNVSPGDGGAGAGISNSGTLTLIDCTINGNTAGQGGDGGNFGGNGGNGGGIYIDQGSMTLTNVIISNNIAGNTGNSGNGGGGGSGGGISIPNTNVVATLTNTTLNGNTAGTSAQGGPGYGGGIMNAGVLSITGSTLSGNTSSSFGGGIINQGSASLKMTNSTVSGNQAQTGGGISDDSNTSLSLTNCTIANNSATINNTSGLYTAGSHARVRNTIIAANGVGGAGPDVLGNFVSLGHNLVGNADGSSGLNATGDQTGITGSPLNAMLGSLANNGGPTKTHALLTGSPALDAANNCVTEAAHCNDSNILQLTTDQRGAAFFRLVDGPDADAIATIDIGAYEKQRSFPNLTDGSTFEDTQFMTVFDLDNVASVTSVTAVSSNTVLVPNDSANIAVTISGSVCALTINPALNQSGATNIDVTVNRNSGSSTQSFALTVVAVNDAPSFTKGPDQSVIRNSGAQTVNNWATAISPGPADESGQTLAFQIVSNSNPSLFSAAPAVSSSGTLTYTSALNTTGSATMVIKLVDNDGSANGGSDTSQLQSFKITVLDGGQFVLSSSSYTFGESDGSAVITVIRNFGSAGEARVDYATQNGTAIAGLDYVATSGTLVFADGVSSQTFSVPILDDSIDENDEGLVLKLSNATGTGSLGSPADATFFITDDDPPPTLNINDASVTEGNSGTTNAVFTVTLTGQTARFVTVHFNTATNTATASDFLSNAGSVSFNPGETTKTITVSVIGDLTIESNETFFVNLSSQTFSTLARATGIGTIVNDDSSIQFSSSALAVNESTAFVSVTVARNGSVSDPATVKYATTDSTDVNFNCNPSTTGQPTGQASRKCDYHLSAGRLRFAAGEASKQIIISIVNDVYVEPSETFTITLSNPTGTVLSNPSSMTVRIDDNDAPNQANPIDGTAFYVRMLYVDLLSREPEPAGLAGWVHRIDFCGQPGEPPPPCDRVTVGGDGFLRSAEFFDREFFVIRLYRTALGRIPRYDDVADLAFVSGFLTDADLELNKQEVVSDIMSRSEFGSIYNSLTNAQYVDTLIQTASVTLPGGVRDGWVNALSGVTKTRAQVFRELSERPEVSAKYLHEAQVVSCYYGFFTRNPDAAYLNFLDRLDRGEINLGDLANAFINAAEYRQRFGP